MFSLACTTPMMRTAACVRRAVWGLPYADDAVLKSAEGLDVMVASQCDRLRSSRPHGVGKEDGDDAATNTRQDILDPTARH